MVQMVQITYQNCMQPVRNNRKYIFSDHNGMKLETNTRGETWKIHKYVVIKQHTLFENLFLIEGQLLYNVVLISAIQQHESAINIHISPPS